MQNYTSKNTSINTWRLPAIYNKLNWKELKRDALKKHPATPLLVYDYGCGKNPHLIRDHLATMGIEYHGYDKYWFPEAVCKRHPDVIVCSNVLNVIDSATEVRIIQSWIRSFCIPFFITVWEGDKSYISRATKKDCWQANKPTEEYLFHYSDRIKNKIITHEDYLGYIL